MDYHTVSLARCQEDGRLFLGGSCKFDEIACLPVRTRCFTAGPLLVPVSQQQAVKSRACYNKDEILKLLPNRTEWFAGKSARSFLPSGYLPVLSHERSVVAYGCGPVMASVRGN